MTYYWGPVNGTTPAAKLTTPSVLAKPDIAATDGGQTTFFAQNIGGVWRFYGTSESAPHAGAVAALIRDGFASATVAQVVNAEKTTAVAVGTFGADAMGSGLVNALGAVAKLLPAATIGDVSVTEGNSGTKLLTFTVTLNRSNTRTMSLRYATKNLTATAGSDYVAKTGTLLFAPGQVSKPISITIIGDTTHEANETFGVVLSKSVRMKFADSVGVGTITNDDL